MDDAGTHIATWRNDAGSATFTLDLNVTFVCRVGCIVGICVGSLVFIGLVITAVVVTVFLVRMCYKGRQKKSEGEKEDKGVSLT